MFILVRVRSWSSPSLTFNLGGNQHFRYIKILYHVRQWNLTWDCNQLISTPISVYGRLDPRSWFISGNLNLNKLNYLRWGNLLSVWCVPTSLIKITYCVWIYNLVRSWNQHDPKKYLSTQPKLNSFNRIHYMKNELV